jgi:hypothetical protein
VLETVIRETVNQAKQWWTFVEQSFTSRVTFMFAGESDALVFKMTNSQFLFDAS